jgi:predicted phage terminase large subunit-like protein
LIGKNPEQLVACVSYSDELATDLAAQFRRIIHTHWYRRAFPTVRIRRDTADKMLTTRGGGRIALSVNGSFTGRGADLIIIDDPLNANDTNSINARTRNIDWYNNTLVSRLNNPREGAIVLVMQRLHEDDLAGHLLKSDADSWQQLILPAINGDEQRKIRTSPYTFRTWEPGELLHPEHLDRDTLESRRKTSGSAVFQAQYLQQPVPAEGAMIKRDWFRTWTELPDPGAYPRIVQSWDIASTKGEHSNWSVCTTWLIVGNKYYLTHVWRNKLEFPDLRKQIAKLAKDHDAKVILIENAGIGKTILQDLDRSPPTGMPAPIWRTPKGSKADRMAVQSARIEAGQVWLPEDAPWLADYLSELLAFREGATQDDQVDATSQFLDWATQDGDVGELPTAVGPGIQTF